MGEYPIKAVSNDVALEGSVFVENDMYDIPQKVMATLKTVFSIKVDKECEIAIKDAKDVAVCPDAKLQDGVLACETSEKYDENNFTIEISGKGVESASYKV